MTYEERLRFRDLVDRASELRQRLEQGDEEERVTREEVRALAAIVDGLLAELSPERWDRMMENIAEEVTRRASGLAGMK